MCQVCRKYYCPPSCPSFDGRSSELGRARIRCSVCGKLIYEADDYVINYGKPQCYECTFSNRDNDDGKGR